MKNIFKIVLIALLSLGYLTASERQFYFIGKYTRLGSISSDAKDKKGVYLRWDMIEGDFPSEIKTFTLIRKYHDTNTTLLSNVPVGALPAKDITNIFTQTGSERRLFESIDFISNSDKPECSGANISNIGAVVKGCLNDTYWAFLASRVNFDVARAANRAYLDLGVNSSMGSVDYLLLGSNFDGSKTIILGKTTVNLADTDILPAKDFLQVFASKCNDGKYALDDFRVALKWKNGGDRTDLFASSLMISGYDLYYSTKTVKELPATFKDKDIATLAANRMHNAKGEVDLSMYGLKKANDTLITLGAQAGEDGKPIYVESQKELASRGFKPGEHRYYFLVPRDFTGNYGPTTSLDVEIPDKLPPVMPVNPRAVEDNSTFALMWDNLTLKNYARHYKDVLKLCSTTTISSKDRVQFVEVDKSCKAGEGIMVNFNIEKYYIYRFENVQDAAAFRDSDLDGYADNVEKSGSTECDATKHPGSRKLNRLVGTVVYDKNKKSVKFTDNTVERSRIYWYRVVSVTNSGISSPLTAPVKAFMPKRDLLSAPKFKVASETVLKASLKPNKKNVARDSTLDRVVDRAELLINGTVYELSKSDNLFMYKTDLPNATFASTTQKAAIYFYSSDEMIKSYTFSLGEVFNMRVSDDDKSIYKITGVHNLVDLESKEITSVDGGYSDNQCRKFIFDDAYFTNLQRREGCIKTSVRIGLNRYTSSINCSPTKEFTLCTKQAKKGDLVSYRVVEILANGIFSQPRYFNYTLIDENSTPNAPTLQSFTLVKDDSKANISFVPQIEKVKGTMLYLYKEGSTEDTYTKIVPHIGKSLEPISEKIEAISNINYGDTWCLKAKTIGLNGNVSKWSSAICQDIVEEDTLPLRTLAWPKIPNNVANGDKYEISFDNKDKSIKIALASGTATYHDVYKVSTSSSEPSSLIARISGATNNDIHSIHIIAFDSDDKKMAEIDITKDDNGGFILPDKFSDLGAEELGDVAMLQVVVLNQAGTEVVEKIILKNPELELTGEGSSREITSKKTITIYVSKATDGCSALSTINKVTNFVVYRQTIDKYDNEGNFTQISPLIESATCKDGEYTMSSNLELVTSDDDKFTVYYVDRYPYVLGEKYKYMLLFFDKSTKEMSSYSLTNPDVVQTN